MASESEIANTEHDSTLLAKRITPVGGSVTTTTFDHGLNSDIDATAEQIVTTSKPATRGVIIKAHKDNTGTVFVGNSDVTANGTDATDGFPLEAGESVTVEASNANLVYVIGSAANQKAYWLVV
jgi:hypothetical protein